MNLATFRSRISGAIGVSTSNTAELALIDGWVNEGVVDFLRKTKVHKRLFSMALTANDGDYELDTGILAFEKLWLDQSSNQDRMLQAIDSSDIFAMRALETAGTGPMFYSLEGAHLLLLHPAPLSSSDALSGIYVPRPAAMSVTSESPSATANGGVPEEFHPVIESYAKWKAADYVDDASSQMGQTYMNEYLMGIIDAMKSTTLKGGVRLGGAVWGRGRRDRFQATPGTDLGI